MRKAFEIEFAKVEILPVRSETRATEMLSPNDPENARVRAYDYAAAPNFLRADSTEDKDKYGFEVVLLVEFTANNGSNITIRGDGESMLGKDAQSTREKGASLRCSMRFAPFWTALKKAPSRSALPMWISLAPSL